MIETLMEKSLSFAAPVRRLLPDTRALAASASSLTAIVSTVLATALSSAAGMSGVAGAAGVATLGMLPLSAHAEETAICYNCPPEWADWAGQIAAIKKSTGIRVPYDDKNSGQSIAQMMAEQKSPVADVVYLGISSAFQAKDKDLLQSYKPAHWNEIPAAQKDPQGQWFTIHSGTIGFMVNKDALDGKPVPQSWSDLLKPEYKGMIGYLDPASAFVGYAGAVAVNQALGGSFDNFKPGLDWFAKLKANQPIVPKQTAYARVLSGEIPILIDYDFDAYRAKYKDHANVDFVIPKEGSISVPYVMAMVKNDPHPAHAKKVLDFVLSDEGQKLWAAAYLRPVRQVNVPKDVAARFLPASDYARAKDVNYEQLAAKQTAFGTAYLQTMH